MNIGYVALFDTPILLSFYLQNYTPIEILNKRNAIPASKNSNATTPIMYL